MAKWKRFFERWRLHVSGPIFLIRGSQRGWTISRERSWYEDCRKRGRVAHDWHTSTRETLGRRIRNEKQFDIKRKFTVEEDFAAACGAFTKHRATWLDCNCQTWNGLEENTRSHKMSRNYTYHRLVQQSGLRLISLIALRILGSP